MSRNHKQPIVKLVLISLTILFATSYIRYCVGIEYSTAVSFCLYFCMYIFSEKKYHEVSTSIIMFAIALPILAINIPLRISSFQSTLISLPESIMQLSAIVLARLSSLFKQKYIRSIFTLFVSVLTAVGSFTLYKYWFNYMNYSSFTGSVVEKTEIAIHGRNQDGEIISVGHQADLWILDFWHTACAPCIHQFPKLQELSDKYINSGTVKVLGINIPLKRDKKNTAFDILTSEGYTFQNITAVDSSVYKKIGVTKFPTTLLLDKDGYIYFRGSIYDIQDRVEQILEREKEGEPILRPKMFRLPESEG